MIENPVVGQNYWAVATGGRPECLLVRMGSFLRPGEGPFTLMLTIDEHDRARWFDCVRLFADREEAERHLAMVILAR